MDSACQVMVVLQVVLAVGPLAVYFLGLGLVNSQARPCLVSSRGDFTLLAIAFCPVMVWPVVTLIGVGQYSLATVVVAGIAGLFYGLLPGRDSGWVIYNISAEEFEQVLERACRRRGWGMEPVGTSRDGDDLRIGPAGLVVVRSTVPWLRNVTVRLASPGNEIMVEDREQLGEALASELRREAMLPSPAGASLVVIGALLLGLPMWYLFHHMDAVVDVVRRILFA